LAGVENRCGGLSGLRLRKTCTQTVFGVGDEQADWLLVGEAPGEEEDARGEPFVGQAGRAARQHACRDRPRARRDVYICNVLQVPSAGQPQSGAFRGRPVHAPSAAPAGTHPAETDPRDGRFGVQALLNTEASIASLRGRLHRYQGVPLIVTYHPAYLLRNLPDKPRPGKTCASPGAVIAALQSRTASPV